MRISSRRKTDAKRRELPGKCRRRVLWLFFASLALLFLVVGCSQRPTSLARDIAAANFIVCTNRYERYGFSVSGEEVRKIVGAVSSAQRDRRRYPATFSWELDFYSGTNLLTAIRLQDRAFQTKNGQYSDDSGV